MADAPPAFGIDFGTTNTRVAYLRRQAPPYGAPL
jgi:molecular chaperone DnaK (HSP70)